ncbi:hypothetical protein JMJ77_0006334 [Colletotrichum scovillei]|uniref:Uncharacterized protein n=1 Tax=Colletotrichum scovillei TaxID=1209932 RepID=A0A9P7RKP3_9PEZI|nr:hypothetical protein JMJ77_0006334 [Colletotrichum scovillei]KAG7077616.1 hypothetical protein JMJ76_0014861 [Colletotrichum scovillei]KAG7084780.1 hypothetical protein JMJ78_0010212 [Colletotrichum scovillei]
MKFVLNETLLPSAKQRRQITIHFKMCNWEEFIHTCDHTVLRVKNQCEFVRNNGRPCKGVAAL